MMVNSNVPRYSNLASELHRNYFFKFKLVLSSFRSNTHKMAPLCEQRKKLRAHFVHFVVECSLSIFGHSRYMS